MFMKIFDICLNKHGIWKQKFAAGVMKLAHLTKLEDLW
jgi:hypothetical protein